jgi:aminoglycoside phosphotransferase family enzyme
MNGLGERLTVQKQVIEALMKPEAYEEETGQIELKQTHISWVFLTDKFVYKIKKAVNFGFLDYSTLEKRRYFCEKEVKLNKRLCGDMYLDVVPVNKSDSIKIGGEGETVEYGVKMKRIPEEKIMTRLLEEGKVDRTLVDKMAKIIAEFHQKAETSTRIGEFGSLPMIETNWRENFEQSEEFIGKTIPAESYSLIRERIMEFMKMWSFLLSELRIIESGSVMEISIRATSLSRTKSTFLMR